MNESKNEMTNKETVQGMYILTQPTRLQIINVLKEAGGSMYIEQIAKKIKGVNRRSVSFHLTTLAQHGFLKGEYREIEEAHSKGRAAKFYELTDKVETTFKAFKQTV